MRLIGKDLMKKTKKELQELLTKTEAEFKKVNLSVMAGEEKNLRKPGRMKKDLARIKTVMNGKTEEQNA